MAGLSLREAAKHFDVSRPTLQKALKSGKISGAQDARGHWTIDPSELARLYHPRGTGPDKVGKPASDKLPTVNTGLSEQVEALKLQLAEAERRAAVAEALADERSRHIEDLRRILPAPQPEARSSNSEPRSFWKRIFG